VLSKWWYQVLRGKKMVRVVEKKQDREEGGEKERFLQIFAKKVG
jgi:hypothetical protein